MRIDILTLFPEMCERVYTESVLGRAVSAGKIEVFSCSMGELYECMVALGTFGLELRPVPFSDDDAERITDAANKWREDESADVKEEP